MAVEGLVLVHPTNAAKNITLNGSKWGLEDLDLGNPARREELVASLDASGAVPFRVAPRDNREVTARLRLLDAATMNAAMDSIGALEALLNEAERFAADDPDDPVTDLVRLVYTPADSTRSFSLIVYSGDITGIPRTLSGEDAGFFIKRPVVTIRAICDPLAYGAGLEGYLGNAKALSPSMLLALDSTNGATDLSGNGRNGTGVGGVNIGGFATGPLVGDNDGSTDFDGTNDRITTTYGTRRNWFPNPSGETGTTGFFGYSGSTLSQYTADSYAGAACLRSKKSAAACGIQSQSPINGGGAFEGNTVTASVWIKAGPDYDGTTQLRFLLREYESDGSTLVGTTTETIGVVPDEWTQIEVTRDFSATGAQAYIFLIDVGTFGSQMDVLMDGWLLEVADGAGDYFDGSGYIDESGNWISDPGGHVGWTGTAHASASDKGCFANGTTRTFCGWAYRDASADADAIVGSGLGSGSVILRLNSGADTATFFPKASASTTWAWPGSTQWVHWALVFNEATDSVSFYTNGILVSTQTNADQYSASAGFLLGTRSGTSDPFDGKMFGLAVYERGLNAEEIAQLYEAGTSPALSPPRTTWLDTTVSGTDTATSVKVPASGSIAGDVSPWTRVLLEDDASMIRDRIVLGLRQGEGSVTPSIAVGDLTAVVGTVSSGVMTATSTEWVVAAQLARQTRVGSFRVYLHDATSASSGSARLVVAPAGSSRKTGSVGTVSDGATFDLDLGEVSADSSWDAWIETTGSVKFSAVILVPTDSFVEVTGAAPGRQLIGKLSVSDGFATSADLDGDSLTAGEHSGTWTVNGTSTTPFSVTGTIAERSASSMASPAVAYAGTQDYLNVNIDATIKAGTLNLAGTPAPTQTTPFAGIFARRTTATTQGDYIVAGLALEAGYGNASVGVWKYISGTFTRIYQGPVRAGWIAWGLTDGPNLRFRFQTTEDGRWYVGVGSTFAAPDEVASGSDPDLADGGTLAESAEARVGLFHFGSWSTASVGYWSGFSVSALTGITPPPIPADGEIALAGAKLLTEPGAEHPYTGSSGLALRQGVDNNLTMFVRRPSTIAGTGDAATEPLGVTVSGWPRYLSVPHE